MQSAKTESVRVERAPILTCGPIVLLMILAPGPMKHGTTVIAFVEDPDGYKIELIAKKDTGTGLGV